MPKRLTGQIQTREHNLPLQHHRVSAAVILPSFRGQQSVVDHAITSSQSSKSSQANGLQSVTDHAPIPRQGTVPKSANKVHSVADHVQPQGADKPQHSVIDHADIYTCSPRGPGPEGSRDEDFQLLYNRQPKEHGASILDPAAAPFIVRNPELIHGGRCVPDLASDWASIQQKQHRDHPPN